MASSTNVRALTLRLDPELHRTITKMAQRRNVSVNALVHEQLEQVVRLEEETSRYDAYSALGQDAETCDVEYARFAQAEVMLRDEP